MRISQENRQLLKTSMVKRRKRDPTHQEVVEAAEVAEEDVEETEDMVTTLPRERTRKKTEGTSALNSASRSKRESSRALTMTICPTTQPQLTASQPVEV